MPIARGSHDLSGERPVPAVASRAAVAGDAQAARGGRAEPEAPARGVPDLGAEGFAE